MARFDPLTLEEIEKCLAAVDRLRWKTGEPVDATYRTVFLALRWMGCHPSVLAAPVRHGLVLRERKGIWEAIWKRPKTQKPCRVPVPPELVAPLQVYLARPFSRANIHRIVAWIGREAGLEGIGPRTLRHTRAMQIKRLYGDRAAQDALGVDESTLAAYTALSQDRFVEEAAKEFEPGPPRKGGMGP